MHLQWLKATKRVVRCLVVLGACSASYLAGAETKEALRPLDIPDAVDGVPTDPVEFCQWIITSRTRAAMQALRASEDGAKYGFSHSDAYLAWIMASAYQGDGWSPFCRDTELRDLAFRLLDALTTARLQDAFPGGNHPIVFGLHGYAFAVLRWKETGAAPPEKLDRWVEGVRKSAEYAIRYTARGQYVGDYANPEMYYLSGLAAAWKLTGEPRYREEAATALRRYRDDTFPDGGVAYFRGTNAKVGYQHMVVKAVCLYYELTGDAYAKELLDCYARYFPMVYHRAGVFSPSEHPWLKHYVGEWVNPAVPDMIASLTGDGRNETVARIAAHRAAEAEASAFPSFMSDPDKRVRAWYNFHHVTFACAAVRLHKEVEPEPLADRWVGPDENVRGIRGRWDDWMAVVTSRRGSVTLPGCLIADPAEPHYPLDSGLLFFACEYGGKPIQKPDGFQIDRAQHIMSQWEPVHHRTLGRDGAVVSVWSGLRTPYWGHLPTSTAEDSQADPGAWEYIQAWITWKNSLIGLIRMDALRDPPEPEKPGYVRIRPVFIPQNRELAASEQNGGLSGSYGRLQFLLRPLAENEGWQFAEIDNWSISQFLSIHGGTYVYVHPKSPVYQKTNETWQRGDKALLYAAFWDQRDPAIRADDPEAFQAVMLKDRAGAVVIRRSKTSAVVFAVALSRRWVQLQLDTGPDWSVDLRHGDDPLPTFQGEPVRFSLLGGQTAVLEIRSEQQLSAADVARSLHVTGGRFRVPEPWPVPY
ncbi:MAG: hypothetical protein HQ582_30700 [Planctomycetes bacterium]|nr:hypothetical protein [Planctomycetota bacterium]